MLRPLFDPTNQFNNKNGSILVGGKLYVYYINRTALADSWKDENKISLNTNPIILDNNGRAQVFVDTIYSYTLVVCDRNGKELFSQDISVNEGGGSGVSGMADITSDGTINVTTAISETGTTFNLGVNQDAVAMKSDISSFYNVDVKGGANISVSTAIDGLNKTFTISGSEGKIYDGISPIVVDNENNLISANSVGIGVQNPLTIVQDDDEAFILGVDSAFVSAVSGAASTSWVDENYMKISQLSSDDGYWVSYSGIPFAGEGSVGYEAGDYIDITNKVISVTGLQTELSDEQLSAISSVSSISSIVNNDINYISGVIDTNSADFSGYIDYVSASISGYQPLSPSAELSAGEGIGISVIDDKIVISADVTTNTLTSYYTKNETSSKEEIYDALNNKQDSLTLEQLSAISSVSSLELTGDYLDKASADTLYYPLNSNPSSYLVPSDLNGYATTSQTNYLSGTITSNSSDFSGYIDYLSGAITGGGYGKVYDGIDPIVVDNDNDEISINNVPFGVQEPLYVVQDTDNGYIIGCSGQGGTATGGDVYTSGFGYYDDRIASYSGSAFYWEQVPWISGWKNVNGNYQLNFGDTVTLISSMDVSGHKNHAVGVKGGSYTLPSLSISLNDQGQISSISGHELVGSTTDPTINVIAGQGIGITQVNDDLVISADVTNNTLTSYYTKTETDNLLTAKQDSLTGEVQNGLDQVYTNSANWNNSMSGLFLAEYGKTSYNDVKSAVDANRIVYCITGGRCAFLAYSASTNYEFQYYRSLTGHSDAQQGDQVFVYKIEKNTGSGTWSTTTREAYTRVSAGNGLSSTYGSNRITLGIKNIDTYATNTDLQYVSGQVDDKLTKSSADTLYQQIGDYLSGNVLDSVSGNWNDTYNAVSTNSSTWDSVTAKQDTISYTYVEV